MSDPSVDLVTRAAVQTWLESLTLTPPPTAVVTDLPEPNDVHTLPVLAGIWVATGWDLMDEPEVAGMVGDRAVLDFGELAAPFNLIWRCGSRDVADVARSEIRAAFLFAALEAGSVGNGTTLRLAATYAGTHAFELAIRLTAEHLSGPKEVDGVMRNYWELTLVGEIAYPLLHIEPEGAGTGLMDIIVDLKKPLVAGPTEAFEHPPFELNDLPPDYTPVTER